VVAAVASVLPNGGSGMRLPTGFAVLGYQVTGFTGTLSRYGIAVGAVAVSGLSLLADTPARTNPRRASIRRRT
jgi:hypothetical protein